MGRRGLRNRIRAALTSRRIGNVALSRMAPCACETEPMSSDRLAAETRATSGFAPCFPVRYVQAALAHYEQLGFEVMPFEDGMEWAWVRFGAAEIHLFLKKDHNPSTTAAAADLKVDNVDELVRTWSATGVNGTSDPYDTPYNMREAVHVDIDNNLIRIDSPLRT
jgi:hypothetical protein